MHFNLGFLAFLAPLVAATITINVPNSPQSSTMITVTWTGFNPSTDPGTMTLELLNPTFHNAFALANNVDPSTGSITVLFPSIPESDQYVLELVDIGNINNVFGSSATFFIAGPSSLSASQSSTSKLPTSIISTGSSGGTSKTSSTTGLPSSTSSFGVIVTTSSTSSSTSSGAVASNTTPAGTSSGASPATTFSGALSSRLNLGSHIALVLSAIAGAAIVAL